MAEETPDPDPGATLIEWGWLLVGPASPGLRASVESARAQVQQTLEREFPRFRWHLPLIARERAAQADVDEPMVRLREGEEEREARCWDFALVLTPQDLRSYYKSFALAVPSRALAVALLSLARLAPPEAGAPADGILATRIAALALHLFGDLNGLWHREAPGAAMTPPSTPADLDAPRSLSAEEIDTLGAALEEVADLRLEERESPPWAALFYLRAAWTQRGEIRSAVLQARPWELPFRLSRLTAAALSALFVLVLTAEVWDLATRQTPARVALLSALVWVATTDFVLWRQKLVLRRPRSALSERVVSANVSALLVVLLGMVFAYALLFALAIGAAQAFYGPELIASWAPSVAPEVGLRDLAVLAGFVSSLALVIGSLGASFEGNHYFQHVIYADEEI